MFVNKEENAFFIHFLLQINAHHLRLVHLNKHKKHQTREIKVSLRTMFTFYKFIVNIKIDINICIFTTLIRRDMFFIDKVFTNMQ